jgi:hypothetical protein
MNLPLTPFERAHEARSRACYNCHIYARLIANSRRWDKWMRIAAVVFSSSAVVTAIAAFESRWLVVGVNVVVALISALSLVLRLSDRIKGLEDLYSRYVDACNRLRSLVEQGDDLDATQLVVALGMLDQLSKDEIKLVDRVDEEVGDEAWHAVIKEYGLELDAEQPAKALPERPLTPRLE